MLDDVDVVISATGAQEFTLTKQDIPAGHNLMIIDLSLPRDIDNAVAELDNVTLINIERLSHSLDAADTEVAGGADPQVAARAIVREELEAYSSAQRVREIVPAVAALRRRAADVVECELGRLQQKSPDLTDEQIGDVSQALKRVVDKLLHEPTVRAKKLAANSGTVSHETALQELFGLQLEGSGVSVDVKELPENLDASVSGKDV